jgi:hypothetical protein
MSVTSENQTRIVFCEGIDKGSDVLLLARLLKPEPAGAFRLLIHPMGGKDAARRYVQGYARGNRNWVVFRDRDLDLQPDEAGRLRVFDHPERKIEQVYLTGLSCLESYFLNPDLVMEYLKKFSPVGDLPSAATLADTFRASITEIADYQAVRWALQELRQSLHVDARENRLIRTPGLFDLPNRLTEKDGEIPDPLRIEDLTATAHQLIDDFSHLSQQVQNADFDQLLGRFRDQFKTDDLLTSTCRLWFHGKDTLVHWLRKLSDYSISYKGYTEWAATKIDAEDFPDLIEFRELCWFEPFTEN